MRLSIPIAALAAGALACAQLAEVVRPHTYPPSFEYITEEQLDSVMWQLARDVKRIDALLHAPGGVDEAGRQEVARLLVIMLDATKDLGASDARTNHPLVDAHRDDFRRDLEEARRGVMASPPAYTLAESIPAACARCHEHSTR